MKNAVMQDHCVPDSPPWIVASYTQTGQGIQESAVAQERSIQVQPSAGTLLSWAHVYTHKQLLAGKGTLAILEDIQWSRSHRLHQW
jgi:hypothetical protein